MNFTKRLLGGKLRTSALVSAALVLIVTSVIVGYDSDQPPPSEPAEVVAEKFFEFISQARIRGGSLVIREAYKLIDSERSRMSEARFIEIVQNYPSGFSVEIVGTEIVERRAKVTFEYRVASMFGEGFTISNAIALNIDEATNTWKVDFTGETDAQDPIAMKAAAK